MQTKRKYPQPIILGQPLPPQILGRLMKKRNARIAREAGIDLSWPDRHAAHLDFIAEPAKGLFPMHPALAEIAADVRRKGKSTTAQPRWPNPDMVHAEIARMYTGKPVADNTGNVVVGALNCEFGNGSKFRFFSGSYQEVFSHYHVQHLEEVSPDGVAEAARITGRRGECSDANKRQQAVGFLLHPRMKVVKGPIQYDSFAQIQGIPELRPAFRMDLQDSVAENPLTVAHIVVHPKSLRDGPQIAVAVQDQQWTALVKELAPELAKMDKGDPDALGGIIIGGDVNFKVQRYYSNARALYAAGFRLVARLDTRPTQVFSRDSRLDCFFVKGLDHLVDHYDVTAFFENVKIKRSFTDHALIESQCLFASPDNTSKKGSDATTEASVESLVRGIEFGDERFAEKRRRERRFELKRRHK